MVYNMLMHVHGGCRPNPNGGTIGAAASVVTGKFGGQGIWQRQLPDTPTPTQQRAELTAIILALEQVIDRTATLSNLHPPWMDVKIHTDSRFAHGCMTAWKARWKANDFTTNSGQLVVHRDLCRQAYDMQDEIEHNGRVEFVWILREQNGAAEGEVKEMLDKMRVEIQGRTSVGGQGVRDESNAATQGPSRRGESDDLIDL